MRIDVRSAVLVSVLAVVATMIVMAGPVAAGTTKLVRDIEPGHAGSAPMDLTNVAGTLYFHADDGTRGREPWKSDGTRIGTRLVADVGGSGHETFIAYKGGVIFSAGGAGDAGKELYRTDGSPATTELIKDLYPGTCRGLARTYECGSNPEDLTRFAGFVFFTAMPGPGQKVRLGRTDGTTEGTSLWTTVCPTEHVRGMQVILGVLYVHCAGQLWKSDGTEAGTSLVTDIAPGGGGSIWLPKVKIGKAFFFIGGDGIHGSELWRSDGTESGTWMVRDIIPGSAGSISAPITKFRGRLYFSALHKTRGKELWASDGTRRGTHLLRDIDPDGSSAPEELTRVGDHLVFAATADRRIGRELFISDGTSRGTHLLRDIWTRPRRGSDPQQLTKVGRAIYLSARRGATGRELWMTDGTHAGTKLIADIRRGLHDSDPYGLTNVRGTLFFSADGGQGRELWSYVP